MKKLFLFQLLLIVVAFLQVHDPLALKFPLMRPALTKSKLSSLFGDYYLVQVHPDDQIEYANRGFPQSGVYEFNSKKLFYLFPYHEKISDSVFFSINENYHLITRTNTFIKNLSAK